ncbi:unnamed protein product, partial [marine sediment metagenome]
QKEIQELKDDIRKLTEAVDLLKKQCEATRSGLKVLSKTAKKGVE